MKGLRINHLDSPPMALGRQIAVCVCLLAAGTLLLGCGGNDDSTEITGEAFSTQNEIDFNEKLDKIAGYVAEDRCDTAQSNLGALEDAVQGVSADTDEGLKSDLLDLLSQLGDQIDTECVETVTSTTTEETDTESSTTEPVETTSSTSSTSTTDEETTDPETDTTTPPEDDDDEFVPPEEGVPPGQGGTIPGTGGTAPGGDG